MKHEQNSKVIKHESVISVGFHADYIYSIRHTSLGKYIDGKSPGTVHEFTVNSNKGQHFSNPLFHWSNGISL